MTPNEQQLLEQFLQRVNAAHDVPQDPQAQSLIAQRLAQQPNATYLLVQRALLLENALDNARQQIQQLQQQVQQQGAGSSFLGQGLDTQFGRNPGPAQPSYSEPPRYASGAAPEPAGWRQSWFGAAPAAQPAAPMASAPAGAGSSWLGSAASAAAGVAGGMFLFNGLENLLGNHHGSGGGLGNTGSNLMGQTPAVENITENVYLNDPGRSSLAQDAGADHVQDAGWQSSDDGNSFLDDDSSWDA